MDKILIVDDEYLIRYSLSALFRDPRFEVVSVDNGKAARDDIQRRQVNLCFLDIRLPDMNGLDLLTTFRGISSWTRIIVMTGSIVTHAMRKRIEEHAHCLISKPFGLEQVRTAALLLLAGGGPNYRTAAPDLCDEESSIQWMADDARKHQRSPAAGSISCYAVDPRGSGHPIFVTADQVNVGDAGMCLATAIDLRPGYLIQLINAPERGPGVVRWCQGADRGAPGSYHAGIQFVSQEHIPLIMTSAGTFRDDAARGPHA